MNDNDKKSHQQPSFQRTERQPEKQMAPEEKAIAAGWILDEDGITWGHPEKEGVRYKSAKDLVHHEKL